VSDADIIREQADRIAWLEGDVAGWRIKLAAAQAENQRLRAALEAIADNYAQCLRDCIEGPPTCGCDMRRARAALEGTDPTVPP
jgi:hypothetical protein